MKTILNQGGNTKASRPRAACRRFEIVRGYQRDAEDDRRGRNFHQQKGHAIRHDALPSGGLDSAHGGRALHTSLAYEAQARLSS